ncbi:MAG: 2-oxoacid:ferredoxin oxidoreductase subunit beta [Proteobacteria bacterium]|nr:2-oxoacid:ferredoxin oxidoreductase subunit beta [Pseudomonadota bacterium]MBU1739007.1 2-oxoacid:ferredoxin oxidoreductase subunit beta [Pseudomonadota bacterium]
MADLRNKYLRHDKKFPHVWCPGCGIGVVMASLIRAVDSLGIEKDDIVLASGIGCSGRMPVYVDFNTLHTTHGRSLTFATGVKLANPDLKVITVMGDGDATAIGGNHFIHAARRNLDMTAIIINNQIYGMTGGQFSPTTPYGAFATTASYGNVEHAFSISELAVTAGASFVARGTVYHVPQLDRLIEQGIRKTGFSVIEVISNCHVQYGRRNEMGDPVTMLNWMKKSAVSVKSAAGKTEAEMAGRFSIGVLADLDKPNYLEEYDKIRQRAAQNHIRVNEESTEGKC